MTGATREPILATVAAPRGLDFAAALAWARDRHGKGALRQFCEIWRLSRRPHRFTPADYYSYGFFRRDFGPERFATYVSSRGSHQLNLRLSPLKTGQHAVLADKARTAVVLERAGYPTAPIRALYARRIRLAHIPTLADEAALAAFLADGANLPLFGKSLAGSGGLGSVAIRSAEGGTLTLGDGRSVAAAALAGEIARHYGEEGYIFQPLLRQHAEVEALAGPAVATFRLCTLRTASGPEPLYAVMRLPPPGAMNDGLGNRRPNAIAHVDLADGRILRVQDIARFAPASLGASLATGKPFAGVVLPHVAEAVRLATAAHWMFPAHGVLGFDFALTQDGPIINEINANPFHSLYQHAADRGLLDEEFRPKIEAAIAETERHVS